MQLDVRPLRCFITLAEELSFSAAATRLHITQPTLSAQIKALENQIGFALFHRSTRSVELTADGRALLADATRVVAESQRFQRTAAILGRQGDRQVRVGAAFYTMDIPERVHLIEDVVAGMSEVDAVVDPSWQVELVQRLRNGSVDLALLMGIAVSEAELESRRNRQEGLELLHPRAFERVVLRTEPVTLLVPEGSDLAALEVVPPAALQGRTVVVLSAAHSRPINDRIAALLDQAGAGSVLPPEPHGIGVERYGLRHGLPAISLGWFSGVAGHGMVRRPIEGLDLVTELTLVRSAGLHTRAADTLWDALTSTSRLSHRADKR